MSPWASPCTDTLTHTLTTPVKEAVSSKNLMSSTATARKCVGLCLVMHTHTHTDRTLQMSGVIGAVNRLEVKLFMKEAWRKRVLTRNLSRCLRLTKQKLTHTKWNSGEVREGNKLAILFAEGCLGACIWFYRYHLMVSHLEVILGDDAPGREAWSRLIAVSWITSCSCLHHKATQNPRQGWALCRVYLLFFFFHWDEVLSLPTHITSQSCFVHCWDKYDRRHDLLTHHINYAVIIKV